MTGLLPGGVIEGAITLTCRVDSPLNDGVAAIGAPISLCYAEAMLRTVCGLLAGALILLPSCTSESVKIREARQGAACSDASAGTGEGDAMQDFALLDQNGESVLLSDYCGQVVYLQFGAMWCPTCRSEAAKINGLVERHSAAGLVVLNLITETPEGQVPTIDDLLAWANHFDLATPVLGDPEWQIWDRYFPVHSTPRAMLVDRDGQILRVDFVLTEEQLQEAL